ncbi:hypothetical protein [Phyllobacterium pellucidum]|uniref:hypothetical protein n=1 Tax=Phyllobacterium pellucidum TaxID=2740464 RepID=UPI001D14BCBB|nr:hypothetical protein [Phyllobacterium sp. T1018]UGY10182.1 hypothetical protein LLE51_003090 [Phyllobacterium sp. T1018]
MVETDIQTKASGDDNPLVISPPLAGEQAPVSYTFTRHRNIDINWDKHYNYRGAGGDKYRLQQTTRIKATFIDNWKGNLANSQDKALADIGIIELSKSSDLKTKVASYIPKLDTVKSFTPDFDNLPDDTSELASIRQVPKALDATEITDGCILRFITSDESRYFLPIGVDGNPLGKSALFDSATGKFTDWSGVVELRQVFHRPAPDASKGRESSLVDFAFVEDVRADAAFIKRQWNEIKIEQDIATALKTCGQVLLDSMKKLPPTDIAELYENMITTYRDLAAKDGDAKILIARLADLASNLGYVLATQAKSVKFLSPNGKTLITRRLTVGELYTKSIRTVTYEVRIPVHSRNLGQYGYLYNYRKETRSKTFTVYQLVNIDFDPWVEMARLYMSDGYRVLFFFNGPDGYVADDGSTLESIMDTCERSELVRRTTVICLPIEETTILGTRLHVGYTFHVRPLKGLIPVAEPEARLVETLSYKLSWSGTHLGELATTIPLGPGEQRQVSVTLSQQTERLSAQTTTSVLELQKEQKSDFESSLESLVEKEVQSSISGSASGSYGGASASVSASQSSRNLSRTINKSARRASEMNNQKSRKETVLSVSDKSITTSTNTTSYTLRNLNEGITLNIALYKLYNVYRAELFLEALSLRLAFGPYLIEGTTIRSTRDSDFVILDKPEDMIPTEDWPYVYDQAAATYLTSSIVKQFDDDYGEEGDDPGISFKLTGRNKLPGIDPRPKTKITSWSKLRSHVATNNQRKALLLDLLNNAEISFPMRVGEPKLVPLDTKSFFAESFTGMNPATEPYANERREIEKQLRVAEVELVNAKAHAIKNRDWPPCCCEKEAKKV